MKLVLLAVGPKMPHWIAEGFETYRRRLPLRLELREVAGREELLKKCPKRSYLIALDGRGPEWSSEELSRELDRWLQLGKDLVFMVGGAEGLTEAHLEQANEIWSLSRLTFPHMLVRVIVAEQLYRAFSQLKGHPYHR